MQISEISAHDLLAEVRKPTARPGGGALLSYIGALAINLVLMMDKSKKNPDRREDLEEAREKILVLSDELEKTALEDMEAVEGLLTVRKEGGDLKEAQKKASLPPLKTVDLLNQGLLFCQPLLRYGRIEALADGEIATKLLRNLVDLCLINVELNLGEGNLPVDFDDILIESENLYQENLKIIEERKNG